MKPKPKKTAIAMITLLLLVFVSPVYASPQADEERITLFLASQQMLLEQQAPADAKAGIFLTNYGSEAELSFGIHMETRLDPKNQFRLMAEGIYLKEKQDIAGFLGVKVLPFRALPRPIYVGLAFGSSEKYRYQLFGGLEVTESIYIELKCFNKNLGFSKDDIYGVVGFQIPF